MSTNDIERARRLELAVENAVGGLGHEEWLELRRQVGPGGPDGEDEAFERAAAAIELARQPRLEPMPRHVAAAVAAAAAQHFAAQRAPAPPPRAQAWPAWFVYGGWVAAAASFVAAVGLVLLDRPAGGPRGDAVVAAVEAAADAAPDGGIDGDAGRAGRDGRVGTPDAAAADAPSAGLDAGPGGPAASDAGADRGEAGEPADAGAARGALAAQRFVLRRNWAPAGDPAGREVEGDVVWDARTQTGYMRFVGLRRNDPATEQYQLWIFDGRRDARYPVDGGVFDVPADGEVIVPIRARLPVGTPLAFAVTIERPGGVVVSDRSRVVVIARVG